MTLAHWDDVAARRPERRALGGAWRNLGGAAGSVAVGVNRIDLEPGEVSTPAHVHGADEEIFFVLAGSGLSWRDGRTHEVRANDCLVHKPRAEAHTLRRLDVLMDEMLKKNRAAKLVSNLTFVITNFLFVVGYGLGLAIGAYLYTQGDVSIGTAIEKVPGTKRPPLRKKI